MIEFIKNERYKNISDNPTTYLGYFYFVNEEFELSFKYIPRNYDAKNLILQYESPDGEWCIVLLLNYSLNSGTFIFFSKIGEFKYRIVKDLTIETVYDEKYRNDVSKVSCTFDEFVNISSTVDDYMDDLNNYSDIKYFKVVDQTTNILLMMSSDYSWISLFHSRIIKKKKTSGNYFILVLLIVMISGLMNYLV